ncbi:hypothetical protein SDC9_136775 [bioreactor metagenome]|uniref:Uncharacterized protein n=1 Tax=bioreactor metagenome TaxID=1076179 RepID=A0A645DLJ1_9ZZZZ
MQLGGKNYPVVQHGGYDLGPFVDKDADRYDIGRKQRRKRPRLFRCHAAAALGHVDDEAGVIRPAAIDKADIAAARKAAYFYLRHLAPSRNSSSIARLSAARISVSPISTASTPYRRSF